MRGCFGCDACVPLNTAVIPGWSEGLDPESRDSGFDASHRPGMTRRESHDPHPRHREHKTPHRLDAPGALAGCGLPGYADRAGAVVAPSLCLLRLVAGTD